jgi:hypothetical protein
MKKYGGVMKVIAYTLFVVSVLLVSAFARAEALNFAEFSAAAPMKLMNINQVTVDVTGTQLYIAGLLPNPCYQNPNPVLVPDANDPTMLILRLTSPLPTNNCVDRIKPYATIADLPALAQAAELQLDDKAVYVIKTEGYDFQTKIVGAELKN